MMVFFAFILITIFGYLLSKIIIRDLRFIERMGIAYLLGLGLSTLFIFFYSWVGIKITLQSVLAMLLVLIVLAFIVIKFLKIKEKVVINNPVHLFNKLNWYEKAILVLIGLTFTLSLLMNLYYPVYVWDALALYDFTAKIITQTGFFVQVAHNYFYFAQYPLLVSLGHTIVYLFGGSNSQFIYTFYFVSFALVFYSLVRKESSRLISLIGTLFLVTNLRLFYHSTIAYTNLPYTIFYVISIIYLYIALIRDRSDYLIMSALFLGLSTWARALEPLWIAEILIVIIYSIYKRKFFPVFVYCLLFFAIQEPWRIFQTYLYGGVYSTSGQFSLIGEVLSKGIDIGRIIDVSKYVLVNVITSWGAITIPFLIAAVFDIKQGPTKKNLIMLLIIFLNFLVVFAGTYIFSIRFEEWRTIPDSATRLAMFFPPLMIYYISLVSGKILSS